MDVLAHIFSQFGFSKCSKHHEYILFSLRTNTPSLSKYDSVANNLGQFKNRLKFKYLIKFCLRVGTFEISFKTALLLKCKWIVI